MKKTILTCASVIAILSATMTLFLTKESSNNILLLNAEALAEAEINPDCPNGCVPGIGICYCYTVYVNNREATWK